MGQIPCTKTTQIVIKNQSNNIVCHHLPLSDIVWKLGGKPSGWHYMYHTEGVGHIGRFNSIHTNMAERTTEIRYRIQQSNRHVRPSPMSPFIRGEALKKPRKNIRKILWSRLILGHGLKPDSTGKQCNSKNYNSSPFFF